MSDAKLIEAVRGYFYIYDPRKRRFFDQGTRDKAWQTIAESLNRTAADCKKRWLILREKYRKRVLYPKTSKTGQTTEPRAPWKYAEIMSFMKACMKRCHRRKKAKAPERKKTEDKASNSFSDGGNTSFQSSSSLSSPSASSKTLLKPHAESCAFSSGTSPLLKSCLEAMKDEGEVEPTNNIMLRSCLEAQNYKDEERPSNNLEMIFQSAVEPIHTFRPIHQIQDDAPENEVHANETAEVPPQLEMNPVAPVIERDRNQVDLPPDPPNYVFWHQFIISSPSFIN